MSDKLYTQLKKHYDDALAIEPTQFRNPHLTTTYKFLSQYVKHSPLRVVLPASLLATLFIFSVFGFFVIRIVSIFQYGF